MTDAVKTDLAVINERIARLEGTKNFWGQYTLKQLKAERDKWYAADGSALPVKPVTPAYEQHSPAQVVNADGWWTAHPVLLREPPPWVERSKPEQGLELSVSRSNGCFLARKEVECSAAWIADAAGEAKKIQDKEPTRPVSARLLHFAGHFMRDNRYLLPTHVIGPGLWELGDYALTPPVVPFNDWERQQFDTLFRKYHFIGAYATDSKMLTYGAGFPRHYIATVINRPDMGVVSLMEWFNTGWFREKYYKIARAQAKAIDTGTMARVEGYTPPEDWGGTNSQAWRDQYENTRADKTPGLWTLGPDGMSR